MRPIVDSTTMCSIEQKAFSCGQKVEDLMDIVGSGLCSRVQELAKSYTTPPTILLLAGKGHNAADGYTALSLLAGLHFRTVAWQLSPPSSPLLESRQRSYESKGGKVVVFSEHPAINGPLLIIDGIYGTGFHGATEEAATAAIAWANAQNCPILAIDIPSGIDPTTGEVSTTAIYATHTAACHAPKRGCFLKKGWEYSGAITTIPLPLPPPETSLFLVEESDIVKLLPRYRRTQNKYEAGSVLAVAGSLGMMGAASLSCEAAYTIGAGYVRIALEEMTPEISVLPREVVKTILPKNNTADACIDLFQKATTLLIGPGLGRSEKTKEILDELWPYLPKQAVIDADALFFLSTRAIDQWGVEDRILTPHRGEASRLLGHSVTELDETGIRFLEELSHRSLSHILLKGSPNFLFSPGKPTLVIAKGDPGMATAGSGDVLTGMIAGLLAQNLPPASAAMLSAYLHGAAGELAASQLSSYAVTAGAILHAIPRVIKDLLATLGTTHYLPAVPHSQSA